MELKKTSKTFTTTFDQEGNDTTRIDSVQYNIVDADGATVGSATVGNGYANANLNFSGFSGIEEGEAKLADILGIAAE